MRGESRIKQQEPFVIDRRTLSFVARDELLLIVTRVLFLLVPIFNVGLCILSLWLLFLSVLIACILSEFILKIPGFYL